LEQLARFSLRFCRSGNQADPIGVTVELYFYRCSGRLQSAACFLERQ
jgi:hypothetical protein